MKKYIGKYKKEGLPGGPNEVKTTMHGFIVTNEGQWKYPGQPTLIPSNEITMQGVDFPVLGIDDTGHSQMMMPGADYSFPGSMVYELPMAQKGKTVSQNIIGKYTMVKKAQNGIEIPSWANPMNWGVSDYTNEGDFNSAYSTARKEGKKEFLWNNKRYDSDIERDRTQNSFNLSEEQRKKIYYSVNPTGYPSYEIAPAIERYIQGNIVLPGDIIDDVKGWTPNQDAWAFYLGLPQLNNTITESSYKPTITKEKTVADVGKYYTLRNVYPNFNEQVIEEASTTLENKNSETGVVSSFTPLENVTYSKGRDERGNYYSLYDIYDFSIPLESKIGKPYEVYDRVYYKDYGDGKQKPMYYSDKELSKLDINKKNFDTLALQRELANRGYDLAKSIKKDGTFDGILGESVGPPFANAALPKFLLGSIVYLPKYLLPFTEPPF